MDHVGQNDEVIRTKNYNTDVGSQGKLHIFFKDIP
jgi:hypothetical protein